MSGGCKWVGHSYAEGWESTAKDGGPVECSPFRPFTPSPAPSSSPPRHVAGNHGGPPRLQLKAVIVAHGCVAHVLLGAGLDQRACKRVGGHAGPGKHRDDAHSGGVTQIHAHQGWQWAGDEELCM